MPFKRFLNCQSSFLRIAIGNVQTAVTYNFWDGTSIGNHGGTLEQHRFS